MGPMAAPEKTRNRLSIYRSTAVSLLMLLSPTVQATNGARGLRGLEAAAALEEVSSCAEVQHSGVYTVKGPPGSTPHPFYCFSNSLFGTGWTRVARLSAPFDGYCGPTNTTEPTLLADPMQRTGKLDDADAIRYALNGATWGYEVLLAVVGTQGRGQYMSATVTGAYSTASRQPVSEWLCADGSVVLFPSLRSPALKQSNPLIGPATVLECGCGPHSDASAMTTARDPPKVVLGGCVGGQPSERFGLHGGGSVCGLDDRGAYDVDVYLRQRH